VPELPEVEVTRRKLEPHVLGRTIRAVLTTRPSVFFLTPPHVLRRELPGHRISVLRRFGKYLVAELDDERRLVLHLGMTGQLFAHRAAVPAILARPPSRGAPRAAPLPAPDRHTHLRLQFTDAGPEVWFRDTRKFGRVRLLARVQADPRLDKLGTDALQARGLDLFEACHRRRIPIKVLLLDQTVLAGVGNIYADEALFAAGIRPTRRACRLTRSDCDRVVAALRRIMHRSIRSGGTTVSDYLDPDQRFGRYQLALRVYGRSGEPCWHCREPVSRLVLGQRSTHFCRCCQK